MSALGCVCVCAHTQKHTVGVHTSEFFCVCDTQVFLCGFLYAQDGAVQDFGYCWSCSKKDGWMEEFFFRAYC